LFWDPLYEPIWSVCEELELPLNFHGGTGMPDYVSALTPEAPSELLPVVVATEFKLFSPRPLWFLIYSGVLDRHPNLKVVFTENHCDWIPGVLRNMDYSWEKSRRTETALAKSCPRPPSEYWFRQCYAGASVCSRVEVGFRHDIGLGNFMFGADFPHMESTVPRTKNVLNVLLGGNNVPEDEARLFLGENAARVFGFDLGKLSACAASVGFDPADILKPPPPDDQLDWQSYGWDVLRPQR
jgi:predicted TIM-barrel fold metal-dependent hydrolase